MDLDLHYVGQQGARSASEPPIEQALIAPTGLPYHGINAGKLRRYFDLQNVTDLFRIAHGFLQSLRLVRRLRPTLLFSKGGFVTPPLVWATWLVGHLPLRGGGLRGGSIPIIIHESDMTLGLANRLGLPFADRICHSFPETGQRLPPEKAVYTGIPIRASLLNGDPTTGRRLCGFDVTDDRPCVLVMGGSQGAAAINQAVRDALEDLLATFNVCHIYGTGETLKSKALTVANFKAFSYVTDELPHLYAMADIVVARAGATTIFELLALRKPNLLIPLSLEASRGDQVQNAISFADRGFSHVLAEADLTPATLVQHLQHAYAEWEAMVKAMEAAQTVNGVEAVIGVIKEALGNEE